MSPGVTFAEEDALPTAGAMATLATEPEGIEGDARKLNTRQRLEMFCDEGRRLVADAQSQLAAIRLTLDQTRLMAREGLWQISEELAMVGQRLAGLEERTPVMVEVDKKTVQGFVGEILAEQAAAKQAAEEAAANEITPGDGGAPEKPASVASEPESKSEDVGELAPGVVAILETLITQPGQ
jgi:hypothetical protein